MQRYLVRRLLQMIPVFFGITFITFLIVRLAPGDPIATMFPPEVIGRVNRELLAEQLGLNDPVPIQYGKMMWNLANGQLNSFQERRPTTQLVIERLPTTALLTACAIVVGLAIGIPIALVSARRPYSILDNIMTSTAMMGLSIPQFWLALVLILIFSERLRVLPASGLRPTNAPENDFGVMIPYLIMPTIVLASGILPSIVRYTRSSLIDVLGQDYMRTARAKGLSERLILFRHGFRNGLIPVVTLIGALLPILLGGAVLVESIFGLPGLGRLAVRAAQNRDFPMILTLNMFSAVVVLVSTILTDLFYTYLDPRIRLE
jgi:peptide/nickel transport system permease protein